MFIILSIFSLNTYAKNEIVWLTFDMAPAWISSGDFKNQGMIDQQRKIIQKKLSNYRHVEYSVTPKRFKKEIRTKNKTYCNAAWLAGTGDEKYLTYSNISDATLPMMIVTTKDKASMFGKKGDVVSLRNILMKKNLTLGVVSDRPYGKELDKIISTHEGQSNIKFTSSNFTQPLRMVFKGRADYSIDYPESALYYSKIESTKKSVSTFIIKEGSDCFPYYVVCVNTDEGKKVIKKVNLILSEV